MVTPVAPIISIILLKGGMPARSAAYPTRAKKAHKKTAKKICLMITPCRRETRATHSNCILGARTDDDWRKPLLGAKQVRFAHPRKVSNSINHRGRERNSVFASCERPVNGASRAR